MSISGDEVEKIFRRAGAFLDGHFELSSGKHSDRYLEKFQVLQWPQDTERLCAAIAEWAEALAPATVAGPTTGGVILAHEVARQLRVRAVYAERADKGPGRAFRRGLVLAEGEKVLVVDDVMSTGGALLETIRAVREARATVVGAAVLADRSDGSVLGDLPFRALWHAPLAAYEPAACPQCAKGEPLRKPGTTPAPVLQP